LTLRRAAVDSHLAKEEQILFPLILSGRGKTAHMPVQVMMQEHEDHGQNLQRIRELTSNLQIPDYACASWRELYRSLAQLEVELMDHIHLENNILFPRVLTG
jgi:regulator of cell morphogenesis and NO signaling